jgi:hypothetical protein
VDWAPMAISPNNLPYVVPFIQHAGAIASQRREQARAQLSKERGAIAGQRRRPSPDILEVVGLHIRIAALIAARELSQRIGG